MLKRCHWKLVPLLCPYSSYIYRLELAGHDAECTLSLSILCGSFATRKVRRRRCTRNLSAHIQYVYNNHHNSIGNRTAVVGGGPIDLDGESWMIAVKLHDPRTGRFDMVSWSYAHRAACTSSRESTRHLSMPVVTHSESWLSYLIHLESSPQTPWARDESNCAIAVNRGRNFKAEIRVLSASRDRSRGTLWEYSSS